MKHLGALALALLVVLAVLAAPGCTELAASPTVSPTAAVVRPGPLTIFYTNDIHGQITPGQDKDVGGYARIATLVNAARAQGERVLLLDAGDVLQGSPFWTEFDGRTSVEIMNAMGYDALTLGNHEFDRGQALLAERLTEMQFPVLCANLEFAADSPLQTAGVKPYTILNLDGLRVGILGLTTERTPTISAGAFQGVTAHSAIDTAKRLVPEIQAQSDLVIALTHLGADEDYDLAARVDGIDLIIGGHSHTVLRHPAEARNPAGQRVLIVQTGAYSQYVGRLDLTVDPTATPHITQAQGDLVELGRSIADDAAIKVIVDRWSAQLPASSVVGQTTVDLNPQARGRESALGNLFCDAILDYFATLPDESLRPVIALYNSGGLRGGTTLPAGPITTDNIATWEPFNNTVVIMNLTAPQLKEVLESGAKDSPMQVAGLTYQIDTNRPAQQGNDDTKTIATPGQRIVRIAINGQDIDLQDAGTVYRVATNNYLAGGGDGCYTFLTITDPFDTEVIMTDVLETYIRNHSPIAPQVESRITFGAR
ncbi:MAG: bifunctional metallophosphatase/5'-nucleotidase [Chloroflexi bacterium]|nr:bifunctional metallophosphatase/5'-nucleotidase [Chloroflexota bacterium]MBU1878809.1 bifunctional metallophosphatase/5'-nucleotidase [Chloroflexota bacterium]